MDYLPEVLLLAAAPVCYRGHQVELVSRVGRQLRLVEGMDRTYQ